MSEEQKILRAVHDGGGLTPVEAAMETSIPVKEADRILSGLSSGGHLRVQSEDDALVYSPPEPKSVDRVVSGGYAVYVVA